MIDNNNDDQSKKEEKPIIKPTNRWELVRLNELDIELILDLLNDNLEIFSRN